MAVVLNFRTGQVIQKNLLKKIFKLLNRTCRQERRLVVNWILSWTGECCSAVLKSFFWEAYTHAFLRRHLLSAKFLLIPNFRIWKNFVWASSGSSLLKKVSVLLHSALSWRAALICYFKNGNLISEVKLITRRVSDQINREIFESFYFWKASRRPPFWTP